MKKYLLPMLLILTACGPSLDPEYGDYEGNRKKASARCEELGYLPGSPEFYACVGKEYTRIRQGR